MKIRITQKGYEKFTGNIFDVAFSGGVSVSDVTPEDACGVAVVYSVEWVIDAAQKKSKVSAASQDADSDTDNK